MDAEVRWTTVRGVAKGQTLSNCVLLKAWLSLYLSRTRDLRLAKPASGWKSGIDETIHVARIEIHTRLEGRGGSSHQGAMVCLSLRHSKHSSAEHLCVPGPRGRSQTGCTL